MEMTYAQTSPRPGLSKEDRDTTSGELGTSVGCCRATEWRHIGSHLPYSEVRDEVRRLIEQDGTAFIEVFVNAPSMCSRHAM